MFNKELRLMKSYIRKKGTNTIIKTDTYSTPVSGDYEAQCKLPTNNRVTKITVGKISGSYSGSYGEGDYSGSISGLDLYVYNGRTLIFDKYVSSGNKTYTINAKATNIKLSVGDYSYDSCSFKSSLTVNYENDVVEEYDYIVKY